MRRWDGKSFISREDYAIALLDEEHGRRRFTVGY